MANSGDSLQYGINHSWSCGRLVSDGIERFRNPDCFAAFIGRIVMLSYRGYTSRHCPEDHA